MKFRPLHDRVGDPGAGGRDDVLWQKNKNA